MRITRTSRAIASSIFLKFSACACCRVWNSMRSILETPSTSSATTGPLWADSIVYSKRKMGYAVVQVGLHRRIGRGGSASVYLADQERTDFTRMVALKVVDAIVPDVVP